MNVLELYQRLGSLIDAGRADLPVVYVVEDQEGLYPDEYKDIDGMSEVTDIDYYPAASGPSPQERQVLLLRELRFEDLPPEEQARRRAALEALNEAYRVQSLRDKQAAADAADDEQDVDF